MEMDWELNEFDVCSFVFMIMNNINHINQSIDYDQATLGILHSSTFN